MPPERERQYHELYSQYLAAGHEDMLSELQRHWAEEQRAYELRPSSFYRQDVQALFENMTEAKAIKKFLETGTVDARIKVYHDEAKQTLYIFGDEVIHPDGISQTLSFKITPTDIRVTAHRLLKKKFKTILKEFADRQGLELKITKKDLISPPQDVRQVEYWEWDNRADVDDSELFSADFTQRHVEFRTPTIEFTPMSVWEGVGTATAVDLGDMPF